jgi:serine/threonine protein kinase
MIGKTVSHYKIIEKLGAGGMGVVYKAEDTKLKRLVALKFLPPAFATDTTTKERFIHEAQSASALQHSNICTIHEINETDDGQMFIVMDYYEGKTLKSKIEEGRLKIDEVIEIALQIAQGLKKAHDNGIIHDWPNLEDKRNLPKAVVRSELSPTCLLNRQGVKQLSTVRIFGH